MGLNRNLGNLTEVIKEQYSNIGIGTSTPRGKIEVTGQSYLREIWNENGIWFGSFAQGAASTYIYGQGANGGDQYLDLGVNFASRMRIVDGGNVLIGTTTNAGYKLDVNGTGRFSGGILQLEGGSYPAIQVNGGSTGGGGIRFLAAGSNYAEIFGEYQSANNGMLLFRTRNSGSLTERMRITSGGNVGIGTTSPGNKLSVVAPFQGIAMSWTDNASNTGYLRIRGAAAAIGADDNLFLETQAITRFVIYANGNYQFFGSNVSDLRAKKNINDLDFNATEKVMALQPKSYNMINDSEKIRYGFIAQEVSKIMPDLITGSFEDEGFAGLDYNGIIPVLVKAIQELKEEIEILKTNK